MDINLDEYRVKEVVREEEQPDEYLQYLTGILNDRSIPERNKVDIRKQFDELMRVKQILMKPPTIILERKEPKP